MPPRTRAKVVAERRSVAVLRLHIVIPLRHRSSCPVSNCSASGAYCSYCQPGGIVDGKTWKGQCDTS
eukprot:354053-Amphidinium_carterae.1